MCHGDKVNERTGYIMEINTEISLLDKFIIVLTALCEIKYSEGKVCEKFEICKHISCQSSYNSWAIADKALRDIKGDE